MVQSGKSITVISVESRTHDMNAIKISGFMFYIKKATNYQEIYEDFKEMEYLLKYLSN